MAEVLICYFFEDRAQASLIKGLVERVAVEISIPRHLVKHEVRSSGGGSRVLEDWRSFVRDAEKKTLLPDVLGAQLLVVTVDGNCKGHSKKVRELTKDIKPGNPFAGKIAFAVPDAHIEQWYLRDPRALSGAIGASIALGAVPLTCSKKKRDFYKDLLRQHLRDAKIPSLFGGSEYGENVAAHMDLDLVARSDDSFGHFIQDLRACLLQIKQTV